MTSAILLHSRKTSSREMAAWVPWMQAAADLRTRYTEQVTGDDPFAYNETASVSVLAAAAACAGFVGLAEFGTSKIHAESSELSHGRSDFWMKANGHSWAFEFKQWSPHRPPSKRLITYMQKARRCAEQICEDNADRSVAGLIMPLYHIKKGKRANKAANRVRAAEQISAFAKLCDYAWELKPTQDEPSTYIMFNVVSRWS